MEYHFKLNSFGTNVNIEIKSLLKHLLLNKTLGNASFKAGTLVFTSTAWLIQVFGKI